MARYVAGRVLQAVLVVLGVTVITFVALHVVPGDVAQMIGGEKATPQQIAEIRRQLGLDDPLWVQYWRFLSSAVRGDFGISLQTRRPAVQEVLTAFPLTFELAVLALAVAGAVGVWLGIASATRAGGMAEGTAMLVTLVGTSAPVFWTGLLLLLLGGGVLRLFPIGGVLSSGVALDRITGIPLLDGLLTGNWPAVGDVLWHLVLPVVTLALLPTAVIARITRASMLEVLRNPYVQTARAKGASRARVIYRHALPNALLPVVTTIGLQFGTLLSGAILTETVFALPGLGRVAVNAILSRDYPVIEATVVLTAVVFTVINLAVDLSYGLLDPRQRQG
ncbi:MAG TPA: ABC transporter permease [Candidatus Dormibacteraeota bacterium]|nr:ABC transporter permease [Candidatus Dormibacteraeota bacterium]